MYPLFLPHFLIHIPTHTKEINAKTTDTTKLDGDSSSMLECLTSMCEALSSIPITEKKKKNELMNEKRKF